MDVIRSKPSYRFTSHGDVVPTVSPKMTSFPPVPSNSMRSFSRNNFSRGVSEWNPYSVRTINDEVRLWVNGGDGFGDSTAHGFLCLDSEGSSVEFRNLRIRELPR